MRHVPVLSREFLDYKGVESGAALSINKEILVRKAFEQYFATGGFPAVAGLSRQLRTKTGREVDFIVPIRGDPRTLLQVCVSLAESRLRIRQTTALSEVMSELGLDTGTLVTGNENERIEAGGEIIEVVPAWRFLLDLPESAE